MINGPCDKQTARLCNTIWCCMQLTFKIEIFQIVTKYEMRTKIEIPLNHWHFHHETSQRICNNKSVANTCIKFR